MNEISFQNVRCLIRKPKDFNSEKRYPVLLFLHGAGTRGNDISKLYTNPFFQLTDVYQNSPFVTIAPLCEQNTWFDIWERLKLLVKDITALPFADRYRIYVMGASMGGYATWQLAMSMPDCFAAIVPICGGGMYWNAGRLKNVPVWAFHGRLDTAVLVEESEKMVNAVNKRGGCAKLTIYPENKHDAWNDTFSNPEVYRWMLSHTNENAKELVNEYSGNVKEFG